MQEFLDFVLRHLIDYPDEMGLTRHDGNKRTTFYLRVRQSDVGKVIGKGGHTIAAIRNIMNAVAERDGLKVQIEIIGAQP